MIAVALPMGMTCDGSPIRSTSQDVLEALEHAEKLYAQGLSDFFETGSVIHMRESAVSLALIKAFETSLGRVGKQGPLTAARLLGERTALLGVECFV